MFDNLPVRPGDLLADKYRVERVIGAGGMGVVVAARHEDLDQTVALKFLLPHAMQDAETVQRFMKEAKAAVRLKGVHVAKTLDVGRLADGNPYIVMEYLEGRDLSADLKRRKQGLAVEDAATYVLQACDGIAEAHALGIVHRDLKPGNLFLTRGPDGRPQVKVLDFGISKSIDTSDENLSLTKTETLLGSPLYMAPEQMRSSRRADTRSDIWSLGAIAYELLTGEVPFAATSLMDLCVMVAQETPRDPRALRPDIPAALAAAVLRCLRKDPAERFANVAELAMALAPFAHESDRSTAEHAAKVIAAQRTGNSNGPHSTGRVLISTSMQPASAWSATEQQVGSSRWPRLMLGGLAACVVVGGVAAFSIRSPSPATTSPPPSVTEPLGASALTASAPVASAPSPPIASDLAPAVATAPTHLPNSERSAAAPSGSPQLPRSAKPVPETKPRPPSRQRPAPTVPSAVAQAAPTPPPAPVAAPPQNPAPAASTPTGFIRNRE